mgnify:CR=1 FL=1
MTVSIFIESTKEEHFIAPTLRWMQYVSELASVDEGVMDLIYSNGEIEAPDVPRVLAAIRKSKADSRITKPFMKALDAIVKAGTSGVFDSALNIEAEQVRESSNPERRTRALSRDLAMSNYVEVDGGMLVKDVPLLTVGTWTDSAVKTPLYYPAKVLEKYCNNWHDRTYWARHSGGHPRSVMDIHGDVRNVRYDPNFREAGMDESGAIIGDVFYSYSTTNGKDAAAQALARARDGRPLAVSVEHGGTETYNPQTRRNEATSLWFSGVASVVRGACERCVMPRANEADADGNGENTMDEAQFEQKLADLKAQILAEVDAKLAAIKGEEPAAPSAEMEKKLSVAEGRIKELETLKAETARRLEALEKRPNPSTVPETQKELEKLDIPEGYDMRRL